MNKINPMEETSKVLYELLDKYGVDLEDMDIAQDVVNANVCINNAYHGYDSDGNQVGVVGQSPAHPY